MWIMRPGTSLPRFRNCRLEEEIVVKNLFLQETFFTSEILLDYIYFKINVSLYKYFCYKTIFH